MSHASLVTLDDAIHNNNNNNNDNKTLNFH